MSNLTFRICLGLSSIAEGDCPLVLLKPKLYL